MPTDFTADASSSALQPGTNSSEWANLLTVQSFQPVLPNSVYYYGFSNHTFPLQSPTFQSDMPATATGAIDDVVVEVGMPSDYTVDITSLFADESRVCCPIISLQVVSYIDAQAAAGLIGQSPTISAVSPSTQMLPEPAQAASAPGVTLAADTSRESTANTAVTATPAMPAPSAQSIQPDAAVSPDSAGMMSALATSADPDVPSTAALSSASPPDTADSISSPDTVADSPASGLSAPAAFISTDLQPGRRLLQGSSQDLIPSWLTTQLEFRTSNSDPQMAVIWQYISISSATPVSAIGEYVIKVVAQNPWQQSDILSAVQPQCGGLLSTDTFAGPGRNFSLRLDN